MARFVITFGATALVALLIFCNPACDAVQPNIYSRNLFAGLSTFTNVAERAAYSSFPALPGPEKASYRPPFLGLCPLPARLQEITDFIARYPHNSSEVYPMSLALRGVVTDTCGWMRLLLGVEERDYECSADSPQNISAVCNMLRAHDIATETRDLLQSVLYDNNLVTNVTEQKLWIESEWNDIPSSSIVLPVLQLSSSYSGCNIPPFNASETAASIHC